MKILATSDLHGELPEIKKTGDVLVIAGDICPATNHTFKFQKKWIKNQFIPWAENLINNKIVKDIIFVAGNHDWYFEHIYNFNKESDITDILPKSIHYLRDTSIVIDGIKFYGTPWTPEFCGWAFMRNSKSLNDIYSLMNKTKNIDVLISHGPPHGYCDKVKRVYHSPVRGEYTSESESLGSNELTNNVKILKPKWVFCGHIHSGNHKPQRIIDENLQAISNVVNVSYVNESYFPEYDVFETEI